MKVNFLLRTALLLTLAFVFFAWLLNQAQAQSSLKSTNYEITWPNLNMAGGGATSPGYKMGITAGQNSPGLYSSDGYRIRAGFQYIHSIIPFSFRISALALDFGNLTTNDLTNEKELTLKVNSGSAGGYQVTVWENDELTSTALSTIPDTTCDQGNPADPCDQNDSGTWTQTNTYGFGYNMTGTDVPDEFTGSKYKRFANVGIGSTESPVKIMGLAQVEHVVAEKNKVATMSARINISGLQAAGVYHNILTFTAIPTY